MKNRFILKNPTKKYDFVIVIPTIFKEENNRRVEKIIELINKYSPPKNFTWNIYLAYEGNDWNEAINISFERLKSKVNKGFLLMDDDAFPTLKWMNNFEAYIKKYKNSILQFALIDKIGIISWETKIYKLDRFSFGFLASLLNNLFMKRYEASSTKYLKLKNKTPVKIHAACFSTVFIPLKIIEEGLRIECKKENVMYSEDADFCYNALMRGYHTYQVPNKTIHLHGLTKTKKDYSKIDKYNYSYMWLYSKWFCNNEFLKKLKEEDLIVNRLVFLKLLRNRLKHIILRLLLKLKNQKRVSRKIVEILR